MPWDDIRQDPNGFIVSSSLPSSLPFDNPYCIERGHLYAIRRLVLSHQEAHPLDPFILFKDVSGTRENAIEISKDADDSSKSVHGGSDSDSDRSSSVGSLGLRGARDPQHGDESRSRSFASLAGDVESDDNNEPGSKDDDRRIVNPAVVPMDVFMPLDGS